MSKEFESNFPQLMAYISKAEELFETSDFKKLNKEIHELRQMTEACSIIKKKNAVIYFEKRINSLQMEAQKNEIKQKSLTEEKENLIQELSKIKELLEKKITENDEIYLMHTKEFSKVQENVYDLELQKRMSEKFNKEKQTKINELTKIIENLEKQKTVFELKMETTINEKNKIEEENQELKRILEGTKQDNEFLESKLRQEHTKYNEAVFILSKREIETREYLPLLREINEYQEILEQAKLFLKYFILEINELQKVREIKNKIQKNKAFNVKILQELVPFFFHENTLMGRSISSTDLRGYK